MFWFFFCTFCASGAFASLRLCAFCAFCAFSAFCGFCAFCACEIFLQKNKRFEIALITSFTLLLLLRHNSHSVGAAISSELLLLLRSYIFERVIYLQQLFFRIPNFLERNFYRTATS